MGFNLRLELGKLCLKAFKSCFKDSSLKIENCVNIYSPLCHPKPDVDVKESVYNVLLMTEF